MQRFISKIFHPNLRYFSTIYYPYKECKTPVVCIREKECDRDDYDPYAYLQYLPRDQIKYPIPHPFPRKKVFIDIENYNKINSGDNNSEDD